MSQSVEIGNVTCSFKATEAGGLLYTAIRDVSLAVQDGEFVSIVGPTGCGKSTLLNVTAGLLRPSSGSVTVFGEPLNELNRHAGYMFQADALLPWLTARENVSLGLELGGMAKTEAAGVAQKWLNRVGLSAHGSRYPYQLSGGMKKRVALAQCLVMQPKIILMDEPFSALDVQTRQLMENELLEIWSEEKMSVLFVTHDLEEAISLADRVVVLSAGPAACILAEFPVEIERPRDVTEIVQSPRYLQVHKEIWNCLKVEVLKSHARSRSGAN